MKDERYLCDRCGAVIQNKPGMYVSQKSPWKIKEKWIDNTLIFHKFPFCQSYEKEQDVCTDCMVEFMDWWKAGKDAKRE